jgi:predicted O-methyltransferase YrrM
MRLSTYSKRWINRVLRPLNVKVESLTLEQLERRRLESLAASGSFDRAVYPLPPAMGRMDPAQLLEAARSARPALERLRRPDTNSVGFSIDNSYFTSPDAEVLYAALGIHAPAHIVEVGSGNSTRLMRQAIRDFGLKTRLTAIDPEPRTDIEGYVDEFIRSPAERLEPGEVAARLSAGDMLLIDSSHQVRTGNDVAFLYLRLLPLLPVGALIHIHDIFLPYEVPAEFVVGNGWDWCEQYLVQALLSSGDAFDVLWAGHYLQRTIPGFKDHFPMWSGGRATSLLLRKR